MKYLYVTTIGLTMCFFKPLIKKLIEEGNTVDIACNENEYKVDDDYRDLGCRIYQIGWTRSPLSPSNIGAVKELKHIVINNQYDIVHCHTPIAGFCTRMVCKGLRKNGLTVFYTAHGFHFYKGAPFQNWAVYYPIEKLCSRFTDVLITINREDFDLAKRKMKAKRIAYVPGVGIDIEKFRNTVVDRAAKRKELGIPEDAIVLLSVGELNKNKNHRVIVKTLTLLRDDTVHYAIVGDGVMKNDLLALSRSLQVDDRVHFLGYRNDVNEIMKCADIFVHPSLREGLPVSVMEALASGLPVTGASIRGVRDLVPSPLLAARNTESEYAEIMKGILTGKNVPQKTDFDLNAFSYETVNKQMLTLYSTLV